MIQLPSITFVIVENRWPERVAKMCDYIRANVEKPNINVINNLPLLPDKSEYDKFCATRLHTCFSTDHVMVCQLDGFPVRWDKWDDEFLSYDYIGAPWPEGWLRAGGYNSDSRVGNGGCSLRSRRLCHALADADWHAMPDDVFISAQMRPQLEDSRMVFADPITAARFSVEFETSEHQFIGQPFAFHDIRLHPQYNIF